VNMGEVCAWFEIWRRKWVCGTRLGIDCYKWESVKKMVSGISDWCEIWRLYYLRCHEGAGKIWGRFEQVWLVWAFHRALSVRGFRIRVNWLFEEMKPSLRS
jgi:hypothetical protein